MEKRPAEAENGDADGSAAKKAKKDPECGVLLFCGSTNWEAVSISGFFTFHKIFNFSSASRSVHEFSFTRVFLLRAVFLCCLAFQYYQFNVLLLAFGSVIYFKK
jgi:hypothetical protein